MHAHSNLTHVSHLRAAVYVHRGHVAPGSSTQLVEILRIVIRHSHIVDPVKVHTLIIHP